jgi:hypothetical protein
MAKIKEFSEWLKEQGISEEEFMADAVAITDRYLRETNPAQEKMIDKILINS